MIPNTLTQKTFLSELKNFKFAYAKGFKSKIHLQEKQEVLSKADFKGTADIEVS